MKILFQKKIKTFDGTEVAGSKIYNLTDVKEINFLHLKKKYIPYGSGMSYAPSNIGNDVLSVKLNLAKKIKLNFRKRILIVTSNVMLFEIFNFLIDKNLILDVQPGISNATVGGCVAANVHGKNQARDGNFKSIIKSFKIKMLNGDIKVCSREKNKKLFHLTIGGLGLTGFITEVSLKVSNLPSSSINIQSFKLTSLFDLIKYKDLYKTNNIIYSWHFSDSKNFGKGLLFIGNHSNKKIKKQKILKNIKFLKNPLRFILFSRLNIKLLNRFFYYRNKQLNKDINISDAFFPFIKKRFYFSLFGASGFYEHQCIIPYKYFTKYIKELENLNIVYKPTITLLSCKYFNSKKKYLNFSGQGICLAVNLPKTKGSSIFLSELEKIAIKYGCILNVNKDSHVSFMIIKKIYKRNYEIFKKEISSLGDVGDLSSELSKKLHL